MLGTAGTIVCISKINEDGTNQAEHVGEGDVGQDNFYQPIEQCVEGDVVGIEPG